MTCRRRGECRDRLPQRRPPRPFWRLTIRWVTCALSPLAVGGPGAC